MLGYAAWFIVSGWRCFVVVVVMKRLIFRSFVSTVRLDMLNALPMASLVVFVFSFLQM